MKLEKIQETIDKINNKEGMILFYGLEVSGKIMASVHHMYNMISNLIDMGYDARLVVSSETEYKHEEWLGELATKIKVVNTKDGLNISPSDTIIIPEVYVGVMEKLTEFPCNKVVLLQNYEYALEMLEIGKNWSDFGFNDVIVTNESMRDFSITHFPNITTHLVSVEINEVFINQEHKDSLRKPMLLIHSRNSEEATMLVKSFYLQNPQYQWIGFKFIDSILPKDLAVEMSESCGIIWLDRSSSFGTIPLEACATNTPIIGYLPTLYPEWIQDNEIRGYWEYNLFGLVQRCVNVVEEYLTRNETEPKVIQARKDLVSKYSFERHLETLSNTIETINSIKVAKLTTIINKIK